MKSRSIVVMVALAATLMSGAATGAHWDFGLYLGPGFWPYAPYSYSPYYSPYYAPYPYYYPPYYSYPPAAPGYAPAEPAYVEQAPPAAAEAWWYFCPGTQSYYPYVRECPGGWQRVAPTPPAN